MESLCSACRHPAAPPHLRPFSLPSAPKTLTLKPFPHCKPPSPKTLTLIRASSESPKALISSLLAPAAVVAAALLLSRLNPAVAASVPAAAPTAAAVPAAPQSETLAEPENEAAIEEYLDSNPDDVSALRSLMELKAKSGKLADAIEIVDRIIALDPGDNDLPLLKSHLQGYSGDAESANRGFEAIIARDPFAVEAYHGLVMAALESDGDLRGILERIEAAVEMCRKASRKEDLRDFKLLIAQIKVMEGKYEDAIRVYGDLVKEEPRDFRPYLCQGIIYSLQMKKDEAEKQFEKYRRLVPRGHPYAQYFDDNMVAMKVFSQLEENRRKGSLKS